MMMIKYSILVLLFGAIMLNASAQTGIGTSSPDSSSILDLNSGNKGLLLPRVALPGANAWSLTGTKPVDGMLIYNTAYAGTGQNVVVPGLYYWRGNQWFAVYQAAGPVFTGTASFFCYLIGGALVPQTTGFTNGQSYSGTITAPYSSGNAGTYPGDVITVNGITLTRAGGILNTGNGQLIYTVSGTWTGASGTYAAFPLNIFGSYCNLTLPIPPATYVAGSLNCNGTGPASGSFQILVPTTIANTKTIGITNASAGSYLISTTPVNGVVFSASGAIGASSGNQIITLTASGTPTSAGTFNHTVSLGGQACTFPVTYDPALFTDCAITQSGPSGTLVNGTTYFGAAIWHYTNGNGATIIPAATVGPINGLTLTRPAGTVATGNGSVTYTLSGIYNGVTGGVVSFPVNLLGNACHVVYGDNIRNALNAGGCTSCGAYDAAATNTWIQVTAPEYNQLQTKVSNTSIAGAPNLTTTGTTYCYASGLTGATNTPTNAKIASQNYIVGFSVFNASNGNIYGYDRVQPW